LEREWIETLRMKYPVTVNESVIQTIEAKLVNQK